MTSYLALAASIFLGIGGQLVLKAGAQRAGEGILAQLLTPLSIAGLALYFVAAVAYMYALRRIPVSVAFPTVALSYPFVALIAYWTLGEQIGLYRSIGIVLIVAGVALVNRP